MFAIKVTASGLVHKTVSDKWGNSKWVVTRGSPQGSGYLHVRAGSTNRLVHRMVWESFNGPIPTGHVVDHIDRNRKNNRLTNLRLATKQSNAANAGLCSTNTTGSTGIYRSRTKWRAAITIDGVAVHLGQFETADAARYCYDRTALEWFGEFKTTI